MLDRDTIEYNKVLCEGIKRDVGIVCVKSNITSHIPAYPYASFTLTGMEYKKQSYNDDGKQRYKPVRLKYSFTVISNNDNEALHFVQALHDWLDEAGRIYLSDQNMSITEVGDIFNRDNMITIEYEYRKGFDCVLNLMNYVSQSAEMIETFEPEKED